jgi:L-serine dehydratase
MRAAKAFAARIEDRCVAGDVTRVVVTLGGSLGATGVGHGTPKALVGGLTGQDPATCDPAGLEAAWRRGLDAGEISLLGRHRLGWDPGCVVLAPRLRLGPKPNPMVFEAFGAGGGLLERDQAHSVGGGFVAGLGLDGPGGSETVPYPFTTAAELLATCARTGLGLAELAWANESALRSEQAVRQGLAAVAEAMSACVERGMAADGELPGGLGVRRRAGGLARHLRSLAGAEPGDQSGRWLQAFALAVAEENAAGGRVVTAPTNGAAGIIPAVMAYAERFTRPKAGPAEFLLVAGLVGALYKLNASISGAEAGCQGEVGVAASMAAAGLAHVLGGGPRQVENAAEIAMEHNLGLTCDPVGGLVQLPCIERNAMAAGVAVNAAQLALAGDGSHRISLDTVVETMRRTGLDMKEQYKETSLGGLAVSAVEC